jgi:hypothetical protein
MCCPQEWVTVARNQSPREDVGRQVRKMLAVKTQSEHELFLSGLETLSGFETWIEKPSGGPGRAFGLLRRSEVLPDLARHQSRKLGDFGVGGGGHCVKLVR